MGKENPQPKHKISAPLGGIFKDCKDNFDVYNAVGYIRELPEEKRRKEFTTALTEGSLAFPNSELLAERFIQLCDVNWFKPKEKPDEVKLQELADEHRKRLIEPTSLKLSLISDPSVVMSILDEYEYGSGTNIEDVTDHDSYFANEVALSVAQSLKKHKEWDAVKELTEHILTSNDVWGILIDVNETFNSGSIEDHVINSVKYFMTWTVVEDLMPKNGYANGNPFEPIMEMYKMGLMPIGITKNDDGQEVFTVFVPPIQKAA